jgi:hypothetical protein
MKKIILKTAALYFSFVTVVFFAATLDTFNSGSIFHIRSNGSNLALLIIALMMSFIITITAVKRIVEAE